MKTRFKRKYLILPIIIIILLLIYFSIRSFIVFKIPKHTINIDVYAKFDTPKIKVYFFNKNITNELKIKSNVDTSKTGKYKITYSIKHLIFNKKKTIKVNVVDKELPKIVLSGNSKVILCPNAEYKEEGYSAKDNYDGDITKKVKVTKKKNYIEYSVLDSSKNKTSIKRKITYKDEEGPKIEILGNSSYIVRLNSDFKVPDYNATDNCDSDIKNKVEITNNVNTKKVGTYSVIYKVKDLSNNEVEKIITVKVVDSTRINDYSNIIEGPTYINGILIVNKQYSIPASFGGGVDQEASEALKKLQEGARNAGYSMPLLSGYRSYYTQQRLYNNYVARDGQAAADTYSARPGHSEHQTGLAFDVGAIDSNYGQTPAGKWLHTNAYKYGFILRYPKGKEDITGYTYEPWHIRYVGTNHSKKIYESGLTLEEYLGV